MQCQTAWVSSILEKANFRLEFFFGDFFLWLFGVFRRFYRAVGNVAAESLPITADLVSSLTRIARNASFPLHFDKCTLASISAYDLSNIEERRIRKLGYFSSEKNSFLSIDCGGISDFLVVESRVRKEPETCRRLYNAVFLSDYQRHSRIIF